jgi:hypothetical protein
MKRIFKELVTRECTDCKQVVDAKYFTHCKRTNKNEVVYYQRADCKFCRAKKERERRVKSKINKK